LNIWVFGFFMFFGFARRQKVKGGRETSAFHGCLSAQQREVVRFAGMGTSQPTVVRLRAVAVLS
jgi:hypothetical protein